MQGSQVFAYYDRLLQSQYWSVERLRSSSEAALERILDHAAATVPFYQQKVKAGDLESFGVLSRTDLLQNFDGLKSEQPLPGRSWTTRSSGSSGQPVAVLLDGESNAWRAASAWRGDAFGTGLPPDTRQAAIWGNLAELGSACRLLKRASSYYHNRFVLDGFTVSPANVRRLSGSLRRLRPQIIYGYPASIYAYVLSAAAQGLRPPQARRLISTGEQLGEPQRAAISSYFGLPVIERYGCREIGPIAHQCEFGTWHVNQELVHLEVRASDGSIRESGVGQLLVTTLRNFSMPLIRYDIGDMADLTPVECRCGRSLRTFTDLLGRTSEFVYTPSGVWVNANSFYVLLRDEPVRQFRFIQDAPDHLRMIVVPDREMTPERLELLRRRGERIALDELQVDLEIAEAIEALPSGKNPGVLNLLPRPQLPGTVIGA